MSLSAGCFQFPRNSVHSAVLTSGRYAGQRFATQTSSQSSSSCISLAGIHPECGARRPGRHAGRLSYQSKRRAPLGAIAPEIPPCSPDRGQAEELDTSSPTCQLSVHRSPAVDKHMHTSANTHHSPLQTEGVLRVMLLNFSPSFPTLVLPLSWQKLLAPFPLAITLSVSLLAVISAPLCFLLPFFHLPLFKLLTSIPSFFFKTPESFEYISIFFYSHTSLAFCHHRISHVVYLRGRGGLFHTSKLL